MSWLLSELGPAEPNTKDQGQSSTPRRNGQDGTPEQLGALGGDFHSTEHVFERDVLKGHESRNSTAMTTWEE